MSKLFWVLVAILLLVGTACADTVNGGTWWMNLGTSAPVFYPSLDFSFADNSQYLAMVI